LPPPPPRSQDVRADLSIWTDSSTPESSYRVMTYAKAEPNKAAAHREMARTLSPIYAATAQDGQIPGWPAWSHILPRSGDAPYDLLSATTCKDPPSAVRGHLGGAANFAKVHPTRSLVSAVNAVRAARKTGIVRVSRVLAVTRKNVTRQ
jgi:hypothetical protein